MSRDRLGDPTYLAGLRQGDGIHPTDTAYDVMAERFWQWPEFRRWLRHYPTEDPS